MIFEVEMLAFGKPGEIRMVEVPANRFCEEDILENRISKQACLEIIFHYGQNEFQPQKHPSVSVGDVIHLYGETYTVDFCGFSEIAEDQLDDLRGIANKVS